MNYSSERTIYFQRSLNILISVFIVCLLMAIGIHYYRSPRETAIIVAHFASTDASRLAIRYHYALTGDWPEDAKSVKYPRKDKWVLSGFRNRPVEIEDGTLQIAVVAHSGEGDHLSARPAYPSGDPIGPFHWVVGPGDQHDWRTIHGPDLTSIDAEKISKYIR